MIAPRLTGAAMLLVLLSPSFIAAQARPVNAALTRALDAERRGAYADAVTLFGTVLDERPTDGSALSGLERALAATGRLGELAPRLIRALAVDSTNIGYLGLAVRAFASSGQADSAERYAARWARLEPGEEGPYREWAIAATEVRDQASARRALETGRRVLARPSALAPELAVVYQLSADWGRSATEWMLAVDASPTYRMGAVASLTRATVPHRAAVRSALSASRSPEAPRVHALLLARWGELTNAGTMLMGALPKDSDAAIALLRALVDETRGQESAAALQLRGQLLEAVASRQHGAVAVRTRMDAARAFADGGDEKGARRLLAVVAADPDAPSGMATSASSTLLGVLLAEGKADEAERVLREIAPALDLDERERQLRRVAMAHARNGNYIRADSVIVADSSVAALDLRGRIRLMQGDLRGAAEFLKAAGPYDEEREHSVERVTLLALLQAIGRDSLAELGAAMQQIERGDTAAAVLKLEQIADGLDEAGAAESRLLAGQLALARGDTSRAGKLLRAADIAVRPATAAAARLSLARMEAEAGRIDAARTLLESLIIDFPDSAVVPEARRMRDGLRTSAPAGTP